MPSTNRRAEILRAAGHTEAAAILDALEADTGHGEHEHEPEREPAPVTPEQAHQQLGANLLARLRDQCPTSFDR